ncbi:hypothetical protein [Paenibacillus sp. EKM207P]|uniref:hypothetical protein n=1 Tax=Paenibacillus sp. EKM207P TaxID=1683675 RepID=UPI001EEAAA33|nr:hypothetical protein [Paenibacillus sp. EKM207P]
MRRTVEIQLLLRPLWLSGIKGVIIFLEQPSYPVRSYYEVSQFLLVDLFVHKRFITGSRGRTSLPVGLDPVC